MSSFKSLLYFLVWIVGVSAMFSTAKAEDCAANIPSSYTGTHLEYCAGQIQPGAWVELITQNINPTFTGSGGATGTILPFAQDMVWDTPTRQALFLGGDHGGSIDPYPSGVRFVSYFSNTNTWQV